MDFLQNMLENGHSNLQTNLWVHITSNIFKYPIKKSQDRTNPLTSQLWKLNPTPGVGGRFGIFSLKWRERMNLKVPGAILPHGCAILSTRAKTVPTPLRRTRVKVYECHPLAYVYSRVFFTRKSARFYAFRYKSTPSTALPSMLARTKICKRTRSDYRLFSLWFTVPLVFQLNL